MIRTVTLEEAIEKGHRMINYPAMGILFGTMIFSVFIMVLDIIPFWIPPIGFVLAFPSAWLYWSVMVTKWRLWAFENVTDVHELKSIAIEEKLIWPDGSIFEKTEIWNSADKERWNALQNRFNEDYFD